MPKVYKKMVVELLLDPDYDPQGLPSFCRGNATTVDNRLRRNP